MQAFLRVKSPLGEKSVKLTTQPLTIGRHDSNALILDESQASRFHCVIERDGDGYIIRDLQSRNGTGLNGQRVMNARLNSGDVITIGEFALTVIIRLDVSPTGAMAPSASAAPHQPFVPFKRGVPGTPPPPAGAPEPEALDNPEVLDEMEEIDDLEVVDDDQPISLAPGVAPILGDTTTAMKVLRRAADALLDKYFEPDQITLLNARGKPLHESRGTQSGSGEADLLLRLALLICFRSHATDVHLEPRVDDFLLRIRMDGNLLDIVSFNQELGVRLTALVKILCELDTTQRSVVQEGHFAASTPPPPPPPLPPVKKGLAALKLGGAANAPKASAPLLRQRSGPKSAPGVSASMGPKSPDGQRRVDYRVSFVPSLHGQKMVIRVFDTAHGPQLLEDLDLPETVAMEVSEQLSRDAGLILVCGPTGSGKTTTLYSLLRSCGASFRNIITIEDPVEVQIAGTTQLPVDDANGKSFAALLRSVLRQDPDVIMVGEIRDPETARIALQAAMTGHLVFSTIHTRDTAGTIFRLLDLGVEPYMVSQGLHLVLAQRLVRTLCKACKRAVPATDDDRTRMGRAGANVTAIYAPVGCPKCLGTGFYSRRAFFEFMSTNDQLRELIMRKPSVSEIQLVQGEDFARLSDHGYQLVAEGLTSLDEVERAVGR